MEDTLTAPRDEARDQATGDDPYADDELDELLVEEVSIDGMCGVY